MHQVTCEGHVLEAKLSPSALLFATVTSNELNIYTSDNQQKLMSVDATILPDCAGPHSGVTFWEEGQPVVEAVANHSGASCGRWGMTGIEWAPEENFIAVSMYCSTKGARIIVAHIETMAIVSDISNDDYNQCGDVLKDVLRSYALLPMQGVIGSMRWITRPVSTTAARSGRTALLRCYPPQDVMTFDQVLSAPDASSPEATVNAWTVATDHAISESLVRKWVESSSVSWLLVAAKDGCSVVALLGGQYPISAWRFTTPLPQTLSNICFNSVILHQESSLPILQFMTQDAACLYVCSVPEKHTVLVDAEFQLLQQLIVHNVLTAAKQIRMAITRWDEAVAEVLLAAKLLKREDPSSCTGNMKIDGEIVELILNCSNMMLLAPESSIFIEYFALEEVSREVLNIRSATPGKPLWESKRVLLLPCLHEAMLSCLTEFTNLMVLLLGDSCRAAMLPIYDPGLKKDEQDAIPASAAHSDTQNLLAWAICWAERAESLYGTENASDSEEDEEPFLCVVEDAAGEGLEDYFKNPSKACSEWRKNCVIKSTNSILRTARRLQRVIFTLTSAMADDRDNLITLTRFLTCFVSQMKDQIKFQIKECEKASLTAETQARSAEGPVLFPFTAPSTSKRSILNIQLSPEMYIGLLDFITTLSQRQERDIKEGRVSTKASCRMPHLIWLLNKVINAGEQSLYTEMQDQDCTHILLPLPTEATQQYNSVMHYSEAGNASKSRTVCISSFDEQKKTITTREIRRVLPNGDWELSAPLYMIAPPGMMPNTGVLAYCTENSFAIVYLYGCADVLPEKVFVRLCLGKRSQTDLNTCEDQKFDMRIPFKHSEIFDNDKIRNRLRLYVNANVNKALAVTSIDTKVVLIDLLKATEP